MYSKPAKIKTIYAGRVAHSASHRQTVTEVRCSKNKKGCVINKEGISTGLAESKTNSSNMREADVSRLYFFWGISSVLVATVRMLLGSLCLKGRLAWRNNIYF